MKQTTTSSTTNATKQPLDTNAVQDNSKDTTVPVVIEDVENINPLLDIVINKLSNLRQRLQKANSKEQKLRTKLRDSESASHKFGTSYKATSNDQLKDELNDVIEKKKVLAQRNKDFELIARKLVDALDETGKAANKVVNANSNVSQEETIPSTIGSAVKDHEKINNLLSKMIKVVSLESNLDQFQDVVKQTIKGIFQSMEDGSVTEYLIELRDIELIEEKVDEELQTLQNKIHSEEENDKSNTSETPKDTTNANFDWADLETEEATNTQTDEIELKKYIIQPPTGFVFTRPSELVQNVEKEAIVDENIEHVKPDIQDTKQPTEDKDSRKPSNNNKRRGRGFGRGSFNRNKSDFNSKHEGNKHSEKYENEQHVNGQNAELENDGFIKAQNKKSFRGRGYSNSRGRGGFHQNNKSNHYKRDEENKGLNPSKNNIRKHSGESKNHSQVNTIETQ